MSEPAIQSIELPPPPNLSNFEPSALPGTLGEHFSWESVRTLGDDPFFRIDCLPSAPMRQI